MRRPIFAAAALCLLSAAPGAAQTNHVPGSTGTDLRNQRTAYVSRVREALDGLTSEWRQAWDDDAAAELAALYERDALLLVSGGREMKGRELIRDYAAEHLPAVGQVSLTRVDFGTSGDIAYEVGLISYLLADEAGTPVVGNYVLLFRRGYDDEWRIRSLVLSTDPVYPF